MKTPILLLVFQLLVCNIAVADTFSVGSLTAEPGTMASGYLEVSSLDDEGSQIPITIVHGAEPGPVLALIAGIHGYEYAPIVALQNVRREINPQELFGTLILVHIANLPAFHQRSIYLNPIDKKNLNRVFPGIETGSLSDRIAFQITKHVIDPADYVVDMHAGDGNEALRPYIYLPVTGKTKLDKKSRRLALNFGLDHIVLEKTVLPEGPNTSFVDITAISRGKPAITTETGQLGSTDEHWVSMAEKGVWNVLRGLDMLPGRPEHSGSVVWLEDYEVLRSDVDAIFESRVKDGYFVNKGTVVGVLKDYFGDQIREVSAPFSGVVNYVVATPPVRDGDPLVMISRLVEQ
ncbi:MAG: M14 family metallopeptidase [Pseudomonadota bacterium]